MKGDECARVSGRDLLLLVWNTDLSLDIAQGSDIGKPFLFRYLIIFRVGIRDMNPVWCFITNNSTVDQVGSEERGRNVLCDKTCLGSQGGEVCIHLQYECLFRHSFMFFFS